MASRVSQNMTEVLQDPGSAQIDARVSQSMVEAIFFQASALVFIRASQSMVEVLHTIEAAAPGGGTGRWFSDLWEEESYDWEG